ncbi:MAG TPA: sterol desaturase family protein [Burkholderiales bacterium]|nr:sterol desaturase family protein [Burkholderiales bacterium]
MSYYADFILYPMLLFALLVFSARASRSDRLIWLGAATAGLCGWTLIEYVLHRFVFHRVPLIADLHHAHHAQPRAYLGTPTWLTMLILGALVFLPLWRVSTLNVALGATSGLTAGWLWYGTVHHVVHQRRPRLLATMLRSATRRHGLHHGSRQPGNFGVTTALWDRLFQTTISSRGF